MIFLAIWDVVYNEFLGLPGWAQSTILALIVLAAGATLVGILHAWLGAALARSRRIDPTLRDFFLALFHVGAWLLVVVAVLYVFGVSATILASLVAVAGFVVGFAMKDSLANLAAGATLLIYRPFNVDDVVKIGDITGKVTSLGLAMTTVRLYDAQIATLSNSQILGNPILNMTRAPERMADIEVGIAYDDDIDTAVKAILAALEKDARVLADPAPEVRVRALADSSVNLHVRPWVKTEDLWKAKAEFHAVVKRALDEAGCSIPFPQRDVHVVPGGNGAGTAPEEALGASAGERS